ncbi:amino acid adenylation domain-containing protein [Solwaraspora sp. WMMB335]|uniref:amino acid adenylation domain-containing protein n=1 Tax=Solwaraspora sp. WMMB335 TaxID=3404118 RepID=UPI003B9659EB
MAGLTDTIVGVTRRHAEHSPDRPAYAFLDDTAAETHRYTFREMDVRARAIAAVLGAHRLAGERILIAYPSGPSYVQAFLGCLYAGAVAVPCDSPRAAAGRRRLRAIRTACTPAAVLTNAGDDAELAGLRAIDIAAIGDDAAADWTEPGIRPDGLAFLQYTSGSTRTPRGAMISHGNIMANERLIAAACGHDEDSTFVGWQPLFHDMGLVATIMQPLFLGSLSVLMPPAAFLHHPIRWLEAISRYAAHTSGGPNFAYELCLRRTTEADREGLDLRSWRVAFNAAEPVRASTLRRFSAEFARYGFAAGAHFPCFGMAEATLLVTGPPAGRGLLTRYADRASLATGRFHDGAPDDSVELVECGSPGLATEVRVVDPDTGLPCPDGTVGEIWIAGPGVAQGYWNDPAESAATFGARLPDRPQRSYLRTGDLGCLRDGGLYVTGRRTDMIVVRGRNHYPHDIEATVEQAHHLIRPGSVAAFGIEADGSERIVVCGELNSYPGPRRTEPVASAVRAGILREHGVEVSTLVLLRRGGVPKTTSGKIRRSDCRRAYLEGTLPIYHEVPLDGPAGPEPVTWPAVDDLRDGDPGPAAAHLAVALLELAGHRLGTTATPAATEPTVRPLVELGIGSVTALELRHAVRLRYAVDVPTDWLLDGRSATTIAARVVADLRAGRRIPAPPPPPAVDDVGWLPVTDRRRGLWFEQRLAPAAAAYHLGRALVFRGDGVDEWLTAVVDRLGRRHPALRTRFEDRDGQPWYRVDGEPAPLTRIDATGMDPQRLAVLLDELTDRPFDLAVTAVRLVAVRRTPGETVFLIAAHHLVMDFWSMVVLLRDLAADRAGLPVRPAPPAALGPPPDDRHGGYWRERLAGASHHLDLPIDFARPAVRGFTGASHVARLSRPLTALLRQVAAGHGCTLFNVLLAGYQVLLHRFTGQTDLLVGTPLAARADPDLAATVGYLVDLVPIRSRYTPHRPFREHLHAVAGELLGAMAHASHPYHRIVAGADAGAGPGAGQAALVQTLFTLHQEYGAAEDGLRALALGIATTLRVGDLNVETLPAHSRWSQVDLSVRMADVDGELVAVWEYRTDLLGPETVASLADTYTRLLTDAAGTPTRPIGALALLDTAGRRRVRAAAAGALRPRPVVGLGQVVAATATNHPDAVAVVAADGAGRQLTYRGLHTAALRLAARLRRHGVRPDEPVALLAGRGTRTVMAYLGILYAGAAVMPLDPDEPGPRLSAMIGGSGARLVLTHGDLAARATRFGLPVVTTDGLDDTAPMPAPVPIHPAQAAYVLHTSGSTGTPKGVVVPHAAVVNRILWMAETYPLAPGDRVLHKTPLTFDVSMWEIFWPLAVGARAVIVGPGGHRDPRHLLDVARTQRVQVAHFVPTMLTEFVTEAAGDPAAVRSLRLVVCSGESLTGPLAARAVRVLDAQVANLYGPTEAAVDVTAWRCTADPDALVPIGTPIANVECRVLDDGRRPVPPRAPGELFLGGVCLARGYLDAPGLTADTFVPVPDAAPGARFYRSGDLARSRHDDALEFLGRRDRQVKIAGNRIEPGEVSAVLGRQPGVADAVVAVRLGRDGQPTLVGYVVAAGDAAPAPQAIRERLRGELPAYMVPVAIVPVDRLPTTGNGKLDLASLPPPPVGPAAGPVPATGTHGRLGRLWADHLDVEAVDVDADFFALGGDSIRALRLVAAARVDGLPITVTDVLRYPTVRALATAIDDRAGTDVPGEPVTGPFDLCPAAVSRPGVVDAYPISMGQRALLARRAGGADYEVYLTSVLVPVPLDRRVLERAVARAVRRHAYLRSTFDLVSFAEPTQLVHADLPVPLDVVDLRELPGPEQRTAIDGWLAAERHRLFDTATGPLVRFTAHDAGATFRLTVSSFALDGWCDATLLTEILADHGLPAVAAAAADRTGPAGPPPGPEYRDFVAAEQAAMRSVDHQRFWARELSGVHPTLVPRWSPADTGGAQRRHVVPLPPDVAAAIPELARRLGTGVKHVTLAAHVAVVRALTGADDIVTGLQANGRPERPGGDITVGMFNNLLPLRVGATTGSWGDLSRTMQQAEARIATYRRYPLVEAQRRFGAARLFNTLFVFTHFHLYDRFAARTGLRLDDLRAPDQTYVPLTTHVHLTGAARRPTVLLEYDPREFGAAQVRAIADHYTAALRALVENPHATAVVAPLTAAGAATAGEGGGDVPRR